MLYMAAVAKTAVTSKVDLSCRPLYAQQACMANTRDAPTNLMSDVCTEQCMLWSFYFRWLPVYYTSYELYIYSIIPGTKGKSTFQLIRHTYVPCTCIYAMNTSHTWRPVLGFSIYALEVFWIFYVGLLDRAHIYAAHTRVRWRAIPYDYVFRSSITNALSVLYYANALWLILRLIQPGVVYTDTRTDNPYWPVWSIGRKRADEHAWLCLTSHIRVIFTVRLWYYCSMFHSFFYVMLHAVWARASASIHMANIFCRPQTTTTLCLLI